MAEHSLFEYSDPIQYLHSVLAKKKKKNRAFSIRGWARQLGMQNASLLSAVLRRERRLKPSVANRIMESLDLNEHERTYFNAIVLRSNAKTMAERALASQVVSSLKEKTAFKDMQLEVFRLISDWHHLAILEMLDLKDFKPTPLWIAKRLGNLDPRIVKTAIQRLIHLGLIEGSFKQGLKRCSKSPKFGDKCASEAIREYHRQVSQLASTALDNQALEQRDFRATTISLKLRDLSKAKQIVKRCHDELHQLKSNEDGDEVYQFNSQLFALTKRNA